MSRARRLAAAVERAEAAARTIRGDVRLRGRVAARERILSGDRRPFAVYGSYTATIVDIDRGRVSVCRHERRDSVVVGCRGWDRARWPELPERAWRALNRRLFIAAAKVQS